MKVPLIPRVLAASEFCVGATARGLAPGLRALGWAVEEVEFLNSYPVAHTFPERVLRRLRHKMILANFNGAIDRAARRVAPDVFLTVKGIFITPRTLAELRHRGVFCVNYYPDVEFNDVRVEEMAAYDLVVTTKTYHIDKLAPIVGCDRVEFLHHGYCDEVHRVLPTSEASRDIDVLYVGTASPYKAAHLIALADALPDVRLRIVGPGWAKAAQGTRLEPDVIDEFLRGDFYAAEIARSKVVLALHMGADARSGLADLVSTRTFEIPACGGFMLHVDNDEVRLLYDVPSEIDTFRSTAEMIEKTRYWLAHPAERQAVAVRGNARAVPNYGYMHRARELAAFIERGLEKRSSDTAALAT